MTSVAGEATVRPARELHGGLLVDRLISVALAGLPTMRLPSGLYCFDVDASTGRLRGESVRYSLMVLLGSRRAAAAGLGPLDDPDDLWAMCRRASPRFTPGDIGLALWADTRGGGGDSDWLVGLLSRATSASKRLSGLVGMELAWIVIGLAHAPAGVAGAEELLQRAVVELERRRAPSGLYRHDGSDRARRHLPNFATEIYTLLALTTLARLGRHAEALARAEALADRLLVMQRPDGAWPWLYHAGRDRVVEPYELYSVHQDAMAPMALLALTELTGDLRYARAAVDGLAWSHGANELGVDLVDEEGAFLHRSIRRTRPYDRIVLAWNCGAAVAAPRARAQRSRGVEVNRTMRPYHLGWVLEAWAGRRRLAEGRAGA